MSLESIRAEIETRRFPSDEALHEAVEHAAALAPEVAEILNQVIDGKYPLPAQQRLLFYGLHIMAAGRRTEFFRPLLRFLDQPSGIADTLFGDAMTETIPNILISVFDGDPAPLVAAIENRDSSEFLRGDLLLVLARLAFDGAVSRDFVRGVLERFDRDRLAEDDDAAWISWANAIELLGLETLRERVEAAYRDGRLNDIEVPPDEFDQGIRHAAAHPEDPEPFAVHRRFPIDNPVEALAWLERTEAEEKDVFVGDDGGDPFDPAHAIALNAEEREWLDGFLASGSRDGARMSLEALDGFMTALVIGPKPVEPEDYMKIVWGSPDANPQVFPSADLAAHFDSLLRRLGKTIAVRLEAQADHRPEIDVAWPDLLGAEWADGFRRAVALDDEAWGRLVHDRRHGRLLKPIFQLADAAEDGALTVEDREAMLAELPLVIQRIDDYWRGRSVATVVPVRTTPKVGRNEPCPCGSGKKYKKCCGG